MTLKEYFKNHSVRLMAKRIGISESSLRRYRDLERKIPLCVAYKLELASYGKVCLWDLLTEQDIEEYEEVKITMSNLHKILPAPDHGEELL